MSEDKGRWNPLTQQFDRGTNVGHADQEFPASKRPRGVIGASGLRAAAMQGLLAHQGASLPSTAAAMAVAYADALIAELDKPEEEKT
jgi:hypothetical protein